MSKHIEVRPPVYHIPMEPSNHTPQEKEKLRRFVEDFKTLQQEYGIKIFGDVQLNRWVVMFEDEFDSKADFTQSVDDEGQAILEALND